MRYKSINNEKLIIKCDFCSRVIKSSEVYFLKAWTAYVNFYPIEVYKAKVLCKDCFSTFEILKPDEVEVED